MAKLPEPAHTRTTADAILKHYEKQAQNNRPHLGASEIGKPCDRALWYSFRWSTEKKFDGRMLRLFNRGFREETQFIEELKSIGVEVHTHDENGKQFNFQAFGGHFSGSCDGVARGLPEAPKSWAILEFKTHSSKSFTELVKKGVEDAKPEHYAQMQIYMGLAQLERALYLAVNKDTDELHSEWIHFNKEAFDILLERAERIIKSPTPLEKLSNDPAWFQCKFCEHSAICHQNVVPKKNCRTCAFSTPEDDGTWSCGYHKRKLSIQDQRLGCRSHLYIPAVVSFAEAIDSGKDFVAYQYQGVVFANAMEDADRSEENMGTQISACYTSSEMQGANQLILTDKSVIEFKEMGATLKDCEVK